MARMPEGPEIRLAADKVARVLVGHIIVDAEFYLGRLSRFEKRLAGSAVTAVDTRGKTMLTRFDNGLTLYSHNQLYGKWFTMRRPRLPRTTRQLRVGLHTETHSALLYSASEIEVLTERSLKKHPFLCRVGPDILDPELTADGIVELHVIAKETLAISQRSYRTRGVTTPPNRRKNARRAA
jgi:endonuclease-8